MQLEGGLGRACGQVQQNTLTVEEYRIVYIFTCVVAVRG